jgi:hypothetical protein
VSQVDESSSGDNVQVLEAHWFGGGGGEVVLVRGSVGHFFDVGEGVDWRLSRSRGFFCQS